VGSGSLIMPRNAWPDGDSHLSLGERFTVGPDEEASARRRTGRSGYIQVGFRTDGTQQPIRTG
jgi:hypothetical protein